MIDETLVYSETLKKCSEADSMVCLDLIILRFTIDVIGKTILYVDIATVLPGVRYTNTRLEKHTWELRECTAPWQTAC